MKNIPIKSTIKLDDLEKLDVRVGRISETGTSGDEAGTGESQRN